MNLDHVSRGAWQRRHDRSLPARQPIEQRGLARIGRACNCHRQSIPDPFSARRPDQRFEYFAAQLLRSIEGGRDQVLRNVAFIREINPCLDQRLGLYELPAPAFRVFAQNSSHLAKCLPALGFGIRAYQVGQPLHRGQIELAVLERPAGELAGLGRSQPLDMLQRSKHCSNYCPPAVNLEFRSVLPGLAVRTGKPECQRLVDQFAGGRIAHPGQRRLARFGDSPDQGLERSARPRARYPDHRDRRRRPAGGEGIDGLVGTAHPAFEPHRRRRVKAVHGSRSWQSVRPPTRVTK